MLASSKVVESKSLISAGHRRQEASARDAKCGGWNGPSPAPELVLEAYQNPHPALSHNKMWERVKREASYKKLY